MGRPSRAIASREASVPARTRGSIDDRSPKPRPSLVRHPDPRRFRMRWRSGAEVQLGPTSMQRNAVERSRRSSTRSKPISRRAPRDRRCRVLRGAEGGRRKASREADQAQDPRRRRSRPPVFGAGTAGDARSRAGRTRAGEALGPAGYDTLKAELDGDRDKTAAAVAAQRQTLEGIPASDFAPRLSAVNTVIGLIGEGAPDAQSYVALRNDIVTSVEAQLKEAIASEQFDEAQKMASVVAEVRGDDEQLQEQMVQIDAKLFEQRFWNALENGQPNRAYSQLVVLAQSERFDRIRPRLEPSAQTMSEYFVEQGATAMKEERLHDAYTSFLQARKVRELVTRQPARPAPQEQLLIEAVQKLYWDAHNNEKHGLAMGYLEVLNALQSDTPTLRRLSRRTSDLVTEAAAKRLSAYPFEGAAGDSSFGVSISTKIIQNLIDKIPDDLRIIEREQLENIQREIQMQGGAGGDLISANYLVQGSILESRGRHDREERHQEDARRDRARAAAEPRVPGLELALGQGALETTGGRRARSRSSAKRTCRSTSRYTARSASSPSRTG